MNKTTWLNPPKAKDHPLLQDMEAQFRGTQIKEAFPICGRTYELETLWPHEEFWADQYVTGGTLYQTGRNRRAPYIAAALRSIDGVPVQELFQLPADVPEDMRAAYMQDPKLVDRWRKEELLRRIQDPEHPIVAAPVLDQLWLSYQALLKRREEALEKIGPLSPKGEDNGASSLMSLLANMS